MDYAERIFQIIDDDVSGEVSKQEILDFIEKMGPSRAELSKEVEIVFARYDTDNSGFLDFSEFYCLLEDMDR